MAKQSHTTTRRAALAGLAAAPVAGLPAIAGAAPLSESLAGAIERHKAADLAFQKAENLALAANAADFEEIIAAPYFKALSDAQWQTLEELATTPFANESEFVEKLKYLFALEQINEGCPPDIMSYRYGSVLVALYDRFGYSPLDEARA